MKLPSLTVGVLNFNRSSEVRRTIAAILASDYPDDQLSIELLDNASTDRSVDDVGDEFGNRVTIRRSGANIGPVYRNQLLCAPQTEFIALFDDDCHPAETETLSTAVAFLESHPEFGALCFRSFNVPDGAFEFNHPGQIYCQKHDDGTFEGMYVIGGAMVFRASALHNIEGYDERLVFGGEEYDLALELLRNDIRIGMRPELFIRHHQAPRAVSSLRSMQLDMRNNIWISIRRFPLPLVPILLTLHTARRLIGAAKNRDGRRMRGYLRGIRAGLVGALPFLKTRRPVRYRQLWHHRAWFRGMFVAGRPVDIENPTTTPQESDGVS